MTYYFYIYDRNRITEKVAESKVLLRKVERPPIDVLKQNVMDSGYSATGRKYGVSDNTIRKWLK